MSNDKSMKAHDKLIGGKKTKRYIMNCSFQSIELYYFGSGLSFLFYIFLKPDIKACLLASECKRSLKSCKIFKMQLNIL